MDTLAFVRYIDTLMFSKWTANESITNLAVLGDSIIMTVAETIWYKGSCLFFVAFALLRFPQLVLYTRHSVHCVQLSLNNLNSISHVAKNHPSYPRATYTATMAANAPFPAANYPPMKPPFRRQKPMRVLALGMSRTGTLCR